MNTHANLTDEEQNETLRQKRNRLGSNLLLLNLCRHHPNEARLVLQGAPHPVATDDNCPPITEIIVKMARIVVPEPGEAKIIPLPVPQTDDEPAEVRPTIKAIINEVAGFYDLQTDDLKSSCRQAFIVRPRQIAMYLCREMTLNSFPQIGRQFGDRDHTTVLYAWCKVAAGVGSIRGDYIDSHLKMKFAEFVEPSERLKDEIEIIKLRVRQALLNSNPRTEHATAQPAAH